MNNNLKIVGLKDIALLKIFDILGKQVLTTSSAGNSTHIISTSNLKKGMYIIEINVKNQILRKKIII